MNDDDETCFQNQALSAEFDDEEDDAIYVIPMRNKNSVTVNCLKLIIRQILNEQKNQQNQVENGEGVWIPLEKRSLGAWLALKVSHE